MMRLAVVSHKICWKSEESPSGYVTDGGFPFQMEAISELFSETFLAVPCEKSPAPKGLSPLTGKNLKVIPLSVPQGQGLRRKISMLPWLLKNSAIIWREVGQADAVHTPIPGDVGTIGMFFALIRRKPLFVRHCGNWLIQRTTAEVFWKWCMERFAGGKNVMFATGGTENAPSERNPAIKWIFSTSLRNNELETAKTSQFPVDGKLRLITACRLEKRKGVDVVIDSLPLILEKFPNAVLDVVGDGSLLNKLKDQAETLDLKEKINFHGKVNHSEVIKLMKQANIFCFPTTASEGFPKVVIEALACGLPVVTTKVSVLPQLIGQGGGILLKEAKSEDLTEAVVDICSNSERFDQISSKAIKTAKQYSLESWRDFIGENLRQGWNVSSLSSN